MPAATRDQLTAAKLAQSILRKNLKVKPGERVTIEAWPHTLPWAVALARETRRMKALPMVLYEDEASYWDVVNHGGAKLLGARAPHEFAALDQTNVYIHMWGPGDRVALNAMPPKTQDAAFAWNEPWYATARKAGLRGLRLELGRPYPVLAEAYGVDQQTWTDQVVAASLVEPAELQRRGAPIARALLRGKRIHITHANGTDLTLGLAGRKPLVVSGIPTPGNPRRPYDLLASLPSGAVRVALDERVADGTLVANRTCYFDDGVATDPVFRFSKGHLTSAEFSRNGEKFNGPFRAGSAGRDQPGFMGIGLNPELHNTPQIEDLEAGAIFVAVGGNRGFGGKNRSSFSGGIVLAGATLEIDGKRVNLPS
jgi:leucyl aminopeptidase (aminopeptidase T)